MDAEPLVTKGRGESNNNNRDMNYFLGIDPTTGYLAADFEDMDSGGNHPVFGTTIIEDNLWYHATATYDGSIWRLYLNGNLEAESIENATPRYDSIQYNAIGSALNSTGSPVGYFNGFINEVSIWNTALDSTQIREQIHSNLTGFETGLVSYWQFNEGSGTTVEDNGFYNDGTLYNMGEEDWITSTIPFGDGVSDSQIESTGTVNFTDTGLSMYFNSHNAAEITVTRIDTTANIDPTEPDEVFDAQYWVVNRFGTGSFDADITFTISEDLTVDDESDPSQIALFTRASNADTSWIHLTEASSVNAANDEATFNGITEFSQFIVSRWIQSLDPPQNVTITVADSIFINWDAVDGANSYIIYASDDPYAADWGAEIVSVSGTSWNGAITEDKKFYRVVASTESVTRDSIIEKKSVSPSSSTLLFPIQNLRMF